MVMIIKATKKELIVKEGSTIYSVTPETAPPQVQEALKEYQQKQEKPKKTTTKKADTKKEETPKKTTTKKKTNTKKAKKDE